MLPTFLLLNHMANRRRNLRKTMKTVKNQWKNLDMNHCRTCLATDDLVPIFYNSECDEKRSEDLKLVTGLEIKLNDGLSQAICHQCIEKMEAALQFRQTSRKSAKILLNMLYTKSKRKFKAKPSRRVKKFKEEQVAEVADYDNGCDNHLYEEAEDFHNETDYVYDNNEYSAALPEKIEQKETHTRRKRDSIPNAPSYKCNTCSKEFRMKTTYKAHMRFHTNYCVCETCGKRCRNNNQLQEHKRARHGLGRIHKCAYCEYSSATKEALTCTICLKREKSRKLLQVHVYKSHRENQYRYLCPVCKESFARPTNVRRHLTRAHNVPREEQGQIERFEINLRPSVKKSGKL
ncbi:GDNF-inducible zinc finger protein 1-like isoform X4 [Maniola jurtina]|uniref:GDNF-inducible zinc finger protein 1-like isoform X4 n=1 Tax=Maniola jurtina TaxID=191418 RepID=UPI001E6869A8|nr:GDNF-inducible zinc finger protein 1-like isoform X4 [Maniola jurtina]